MKRFIYIFQLAATITFMCLECLPAFAEEVPSQSIKALTNGGQLLVKSKSSHDPFWGETTYSHEYSYLAPNGITERIGGSSCINTDVDGNPDIIFAKKLIILPLKCQMSLAGFYVRTLNHGWRYHSFSKNEYEKYSLWAKSKEMLDDQWDGPSTIKAINANKLTVVVEYNTYKTNIMTFRLSVDGEKMDLINIERRIDPHNDPVKQIKQLTDKTQSRGYAATFLGGLRNPNAVEALISTLSDDELNVRASAIEALGKIGDKRATTPLLQLLENQRENKYTRSYAAKALGGIKDPRTVQSLIISLSDNAPEVRCESAEALGEIGDNRALEPLVKLSQQRFLEKWWVRRCAVDGLGHFRNQRAIKALNKTLKSFFENKYVKIAAKNALEKIQAGQK